jgi:transglutaminase-like putative cysteine protease
MPTPEAGGIRRPMNFQNLVDKANWLDAAASLDARDPDVRELAGRFAKARGPNDQAGIARDLHDFVRDSITYVYGPSHQEFADSGTILRRGWDNCAGKSRLFCALCRAVELDCRIVPNFAHPDEFNHVQAQVRYAGSELDPRAEPGGWLRAELIAKGVPLGNGPEVAQRDPTSGRILLS